MPDNHRTILIVDDNLDVSLILALNLRAKGFTVLEAEDGEIGCEIAAAKQPSLILCDEQMPRLNGLQTLTRLKNTPQTSSIPVLMIGGTGLFNEEVWKARGAAGFVPKPFQMNELVAAVEMILLQPQEFEFATGRE
jgi:DNA-binding response OmpR family regulator